MSGKKWESYVYVYYLEEIYIMIYDTINKWFLYSKVEENWRVFYYNYPFSLGLRLSSIYKSGVTAWG